MLSKFVPLPHLQYCLALGAGMVGRFVGGVAVLPSWLRFVYAVSLAWAVGHCLITAYGNQDVRSIAAVAGVVGATIILITLHYAIRYYIWQEVEREGARIRAEITAASSAPRPSAPQAHQE